MQLIIFLRHNERVDMKKEKPTAVRISNSSHKRLEAIAAQDKRTMQGACEILIDNEYNKRKAAKNG